MKSEEILPDTLQVHKTLPTSTVIKSTQYEIFEHLTNISRQGAITFLWHADKDTFIDPYCTFIYIKSILTRADGTRMNPLGDLEGGNVKNMYKVLPVNRLSHAWFNNVKVKLNGQVIETVNNRYAYRGDLGMQLSYLKQIKEGHLKMCSFDEEILAFDNLAVGDIPWTVAANGEVVKQNHALARRFAGAAGSKVIWTISQIHSSIFDQTKALPPGTKIQVTFDRNKDAFLLLSKNAGANYWLQMQSMVLITHKLEFCKSLASDIQQVAFAGQNYLCPFRRVKILTFNKGPAVKDLSQTDILPEEDELPRRIFIVLVHNEATGGGSYIKDPFNYQPFQITKVGLKIGGQEKPFPFFECNLHNENTNLTFPLWGLLQSSQMFMNKQELGITPQDYLNRNTIFGWDLTASQVGSGMCCETSGTFTVDLVMLIHTALTHAVEILVYVEYDAEIEIDGKGKVKVHENA